MKPIFLALSAMTLCLTNVKAKDLIESFQATKEISEKCLALEDSYRKRLQKSPEELKVLEAFIEHQKAAISAEVQLIGGSWGGSGEKLARATAKLDAMTAYLAALRRLKASLHFQDMPE